MDFPISIHAPAKGATPGNLPKCWESTHFNPRSREGSDRYLSDLERDGWNFNPRSREGSDLRAEREMSMLILFQSTLPRRERPSLSLRFPTATRFQSTLPRRERRPLLAETDACEQFQSTLPRRERHGNHDFWRQNNRFQSTLPRRERQPRAILGDIDFEISIHAPAKGATRRLIPAT